MILFFYHPDRLQSIPDHQVIVPVVIRQSRFCPQGPNYTNTEAIILIYVQNKLYPCFLLLTELDRTRGQFLIFSIQCENNTVHI